MTGPVPPITVGIDTGGTFTDLTALDAHGWIVATTKVPTTPVDRSEAILEAIRVCLDRLGLEPADVAAVMHGTTTGTNALLERRGARTALLVTRGFRDILLIARQNRPSLYDPYERRADPLVPRELTIEVDERTLHDGSIEIALAQAEIARVARILRRARAEAVAIAFLHSYANDANEQRMAAGLANHLPRIAITASAALLPRIGEYERASTATVNGYVGPVIERYLDLLTGRLRAAGFAAPVFVMQSNGGLASVEAIRRRAVQTILSGPAGGVVAGRAAGSVSRKPHLLSVDMGGTSFDIALLPNRGLELGQGSDVGGVPVSVPAIAIHTLGAGGGSIAWIDPGGALRVGPRSAGADPGPACYGRGGDEPTVTDANLVLGRLAPRLLDGRLSLDRDLAVRAIEMHVGRPLGLPLVEAARGILRVVNAEMARGMRLMSVARGYDPRDLGLVAFGGAGPLHAADLADIVGIEEVVIPPAPGATSARGVAGAELRREFSRPVLAELADLTVEDVEAVLGLLGREASAFLVAEGAPPRRIALTATARLSYRGQATDLEVDVPRGRRDLLGGLARRFAAEHRRRYGYVRDDPIRLASVQVSAVAPPVDSGAAVRREPLTWPSHGDAARHPGPVEHRQAWFGPDPADSGIHRRADLHVGDRIVGPAIVEQLDSTTVVPPGYRADVVGDGSMLMTREASQ